MPDLLGWIEWALRRPGLTWIMAWILVSSILVGIAYVAWWITGRLSDRVCRGTRRP